MEISIRLNFKRPGKKALLLSLAVMLFFALVILFFMLRNPTTIPEVVRQQLTFKSVYAPASMVQSQSYDYASSEKILTYKLDYQGFSLVVTEQPLPENLASGSQAYFPSLGIHPIAQFSTKLGPVAITNFYQTKTLNSGGQAGVLVADRTLVIVSSTDPNQKLTNEQWSKLFNSFKQSR